MIVHHLNRRLTEAQRRRWIELLVDTADEVGLPDDPEFRSAFTAYIERGTRLARLNSHADPATVTTGAPMPQWGWGGPGGPYQPPSGSKHVNRRRSPLDRGRAFAGSAGFAFGQKRS